MNKIFSAFLIIVSFCAFDGDGYKKHAASRNYQDETGFYVIEFEYIPAYCMMPAVIGPAGQPHYSAEISVFQIVDGKKTIIGKPFGGIYTPNGCFEDDPKFLIKTARERKK